MRIIVEGTPTEIITMLESIRGVAKKGSTLIDFRGSLAELAERIRPQIDPEAKDDTGQGAPEK